MTKAVQDTSRQLAHGKEERCCCDFLHQVKADFKEYLTILEVVLSCSLATKPHPLNHQQERDRRSSHVPVRIWTTTAISLARSPCRPGAIVESVLQLFRYQNRLQTFSRHTNGDTEFVADIQPILSLLAIDEGVEEGVDEKADEEIDEEVEEDDTQAENPSDEWWRAQLAFRGFTPEGDLKDVQNLLRKAGHKRMTFELEALKKKIAKKTCEGQ